MACCWRQRQINRRKRNACRNSDADRDSQKEKRAERCRHLKMSVSQLQHLRSAKELDRLDFWRVEKLAELAGKKVTWEEECERKMESGKN